MAVQDWIGRAIVPVGIAVAFALLRRFAPAQKPASEHWSYKNRQKPEPLPTGVISAMMWGIGLCLLASFFLFSGVNHVWANMDGPAVFRVYETQAVWLFFPGIAALSVPWPLTIWLLRKMGRNDEADTIAEQSNSQTEVGGKGGFNVYRVMTWFSYGIALPIGLFTLLAIPIHLSISDTEAKVGRYGKWRSETYRFDQAVRARFVSRSEVHGGRAVLTKNLLIDFSDGRTLDTSVGMEGGEAASSEVVNLLLEKTKLEPVAP